MGAIETTAEVDTTVPSAADVVSVCKEVEVKGEVKINTTFSATNVPTVLSKLQKWGDYASFGTPVEPSRFIPMKTPLSPSLLQEDTFENVLTLPTLLAEQTAMGRKVGLIIDLSNHDCLYLDDVTDDMERVHVRNVAKSIPNVECTSEVIRVATEFWRRKPEQYVAIHCAYGFNRTGFVLCCYLIEVCGLSAEEALSSFATARSPGVKHERFKDALKRRYPTPGCKPVLVDEDDGTMPKTESMINLDKAVQNETLDLDNIEQVKEAIHEVEEAKRRKSMDTEPIG